jgi:Domain of unknown function (DUF4129)
MAMKIQMEKRTLCVRRSRHSLRHLLGCSIISLLVVIPGLASVSLQDYGERLKRAEAIIDELTEGDHPAGKLVYSMTMVKQLLPPQEDVEFDGQAVRVDNTWLYGTIDNLIENAAADLDERRALLFEMGNRLYLLRERVEAAQSQQTLNMSDRHARLEQILARPEYSDEKEKESTLKKWIDRLLNALAEWLSRMGMASGRAPSGGSGGLVEGARILIILIIFAAAAFGAGYLLNRLRVRRKSDRESGTREVLGETIGEDVTASDLISAAIDLARQGDHRAAIRRAYLAVLFEMEHRGKLRLHRSKTNRDYLDDLQAERDLLPPFSAMTGMFEKVWYGQTRATEDEFNGFLSRYHEATKP